VGFLQRLAGQAGGDDAGEVGVCGDVFVLAAQRVGDGFSRGLGLGDLVVEVGELTLGELPPAVDGVATGCEKRLRLAEREPDVSKEQDHPDEPDRGLGVAPLTGNSRT
jgi:hypothetical protein